MPQCNHSFPLTPSMSTLSSLKQNKKSLWVLTEDWGVTMVFILCRANPGLDPARPARCQEPMSHRPGPWTRDKQPCKGSSRTKTTKPLLSLLFSRPSRTFCVQANKHATNNPIKPLQTWDINHSEEQCTIYNCWLLFYKPCTWAPKATQIKAHKSAKVLSLLFLMGWFTLPVLVPWWPQAVWASRWKRCKLAYQVQGRRTNFKRFFSIMMIFPFGGHQSNQRTSQAPRDRSQNKTKSWSSYFFLSCVSHL